MAMRSGGRIMTMGGEPLPPGHDRKISRSTIRRVAGFFKPYSGRVALTIVAILVTSVLGIANPLLLRRIIDQAIPQRDTHKLYVYVGLMLILPIVSGLIGVGQR